MIKRILALAAIGAACALGPAAAQQPPPDRPLDYSDERYWLCLPGRADACAIDLSAMVVDARGRARLEEFRPARDPRADCFYVYPTVSNDPTPTSDVSPGLEERMVIAQQFARFAASCRTFAPIYRQVTLAGLRDLLGASGGPPIGSAKEGFSAAPLEGGYEDVRAAFHHYRANYGLGRPFVLIGHSQGAMHPTRLIAEEIEGTPLQDQLVSAILLGANIEVPKGMTLGGTFQSTPLCKSDRQTGCVITYASFRATNPPSPNALFGQARDGMVAGCTNPADLRDGEGQPESYFSTGTLQWTGDPFSPVGTPFVKTPGLVTTRCVSGPAGTYLEVLVNADPRGARIDDIPGDLMTDGVANPAWGLHLVDMAISQGDLVRLVDRQARAWRPAR